MSTKSLPKGLRRFLRHYSASTLVVVPLHAGTVYNEVLTVLRSCPSLSPLSTIEPNAQLSDWVFRVADFALGSIVLHFFVYNFLG